MSARAWVLPAAAALVAILFWQFGRSDPATVPACTWRIGAGTEITQGRNFEELPAESPIRLSCTCSEPRFVYVWSHSSEDGTLLLFPSPLILGGQGNPLPAGNTVLPGKYEAKDLAWHTRSGIVGATTFLVVASREKVPELEELAGKVRLWTNSVFPDHSMHVTKPAHATELLGQPRSLLQSPLLQRAALTGGNEPNPNGPLQPDPVLEGVWIGSWKVREGKPAAQPAGK